MKFGKYKGGCLQILRDGAWHSYDKESQWLSFDALKVVHQVIAVTWGERYSITLYTPGMLAHLTAQAWDILAKAGFHIYLYEPLPARMRRFTTPSHVMSLTPASERIQTTLEHKKADELLSSLHICSSWSIGSGRRAGVGQYSIAERC